MGLVLGALFFYLVAMPLLSILTDAVQVLRYFSIALHTFYHLAVRQRVARFDSQMEDSARIFGATAL